MRMVALAFSLVAMTCPADAAKQNGKHDQSLESKCRAMVGKEPAEGEGRSHMGQMNMHRFSECMMGMPS